MIKAQVEKKFTHKEIMILFAAESKSDEKYMVGCFKKAMVDINETLRAPHQKKTYRRKYLAEGCYVPKIQ